MSGGKIEDYKCRLPIHQDGSCNGLQHYAGLAADETGGAAVNLIRLETKQDVYIKVLEIVKKKIEQDILEQNLGTVNLETAKFFTDFKSKISETSSDDNSIWGHFSWC